MEARFSPDEVEAFYFDHGLTLGRYQMEYEDFLKDRRQRIADVTRRGFEALAGPSGVTADGAALTLGLTA